MLSVLMTAFLSFSSVSGATVTKELESEQQDKIVRLSSETAVPQPKISYGEYDADWWRNGLIGRHQMVSIDSSEYIGEIVVQKLSATYDPVPFESFKFEQKVNTVTTSSVSTSEKFSSTVTSTLAVEMGMSDVKVSDKYTISNSYTIENTLTYSYAESKEITISFEAKPEYVSEKRFFLGMFAYVYKVKCQKWQYDDYWWGKVEVSGSRSDFNSYIILDPYITIGYADGTFAH